MCMIFALGGVDHQAGVIGLQVGCAQRFTSKDVSVYRRIIPPVEEVQYSRVLLRKTILVVLLKGV